MRQEATAPASNADNLIGKYVKVFLVSRDVALRGVLRNVDADSVLLEDAAGRTIVYKNQIISVVETNPPAKTE